MKGFFALPINNKTKKQSTKTFTCNSCRLYKDVLSPKMKPTGNFKKGIMNIGIAPDVQDDDSGKHWQGLDGRFLRQTYRSLGIDLHEDCININAINCFTDKKNINFEIDCCRRIVLDYIQKYKPKVIITFGIEPLQSIIGDRFLRTLGGIEKWRGWTIPDQDLQAWVCPTISPKYVLSNDNNKGINITWLQDLERAISKLDEPFPFHKEPELIYLEKDLSVLNEIPNISTIAFDFETTGLKPDAEGHKIISAAVAVSPDKTYVFMMPDNPEDRKPFIDLLKNKYIKKIAQNCKYEHSWSKVLLNTTVQNWHWDTQLATHILDNRDGITSLSFQTYVNFGVIDYDSEVTNYLKAPDSNFINRIEELTQTPKGKQALLKYNALDTIFEYRLYEKQYKHYEEIKDAYDLFHKGIFVLGEAERNGFFLDVDLMEKEKQKITKKVTELEQQIFSSSFYKEWQKTSSTEINMYSSQQLGDYLYKHKKIKPKKETATGKGSTNEESLRALNIPELDLLLQIKKLNKIKGTYIAQFEREVVNDRVHPSFNLHFVKSFRSSSANPNFQNIPIRDKVARDITRGMIYPSYGNQLLELDYSQLEVRISAAYSKDPVLEYDVLHGDMHRDIAIELFKIKDFQKSNPVHSLLRGAAKNGFVFPQFYGDYYKNCAMNLAQNWCELPKGKWKKGQGIKTDELGYPFISDYLIANKISNFTVFENHVMEVENHFWKERYMLHDKWRNEIWELYQKQGFVESHTGFKFAGLMRRNEVMNYPIQGAAFHCLLWSFEQGMKALKRERMQTVIIGQIHDAIVFDVFPPELEKVLKIMNCIMCNDVRQHWNWITVPLEIGAEISPVNGSWAEKKDLDLSKYI